MTINELMVNEERGKLIDKIANFNMKVKADGIVKTSFLKSSNQRGYFVKCLTRNNKVHILDLRCVFEENEDYLTGNLQELLKEV